MMSRRLRLFAVFAMAALANAAEWPLPLLSGDLSGKFLLTDGSSVPEIAWRVQANPLDARARLTATAPGLAVRASFVPPRGGKPGSWQITEATIALADWWPHVAARSGIEVRPADLRLSGALRLTGEGAWDSDGWSGTLRATITDAATGSEGQNWSATEAGLTAEILFGKKNFVLRAAELRVGNAHAAGIAARNLVVELAGADGGRFEVRRAQLETFGGRLALVPFTLDPAAPSIPLAAEFSQIALGELAALVPQALADARGQIAGRLSVNLVLKPELQPNAGGLEVTPGLPATFRLVQSPGLLTGHAPPRIAFLPGWTGPLHRWFSSENPAYETLRRIELGEVPLAMEDLRVQLLPDGPDGARTAHLEVVARPTAGGAVKRVTFSVNLSGPLTQVLRLGTDERTKMRLAPAR